MIGKTPYQPQGCNRDPSWSWFKQPLPWWTMFFLVPIYSTCSSLSNLQAWNQWQLLVMVTFSCCAYAANKATSVVLPGRTDIVAASGAFVIGSLGNIYSRVVRGTAFTAMVTGVLFLVPVSQVLAATNQQSKFIFPGLPVWDRSRWWSDTDISQLSRTILRRVLIGFTHDICRIWSDNWTVCEPGYRYVYD
jgi:uncharacterized membrane protein YjjB (DUF3815 family)